MALAESQKDRIRELYMQGLPVRAIAEQVGSNRETVRKYIAKNLSSTPPEKSVKEVRDAITCERVRATKGKDGVSECQNGVKGVSKSVTDKAVVDAMDDLVFVRQMCLDGLDRAKRIDDPDKRVWQETQYLKLLKDAAIQVGKWQGKDKIAPDVSTVSPLDIFAEEVRRIEEAEGS